MSVHPHVLPSLFGRFTAVLSQHENLHEKLGQLEELCTALEGEDDAAVSRLGPSRLMADLKALLATHFAVEEAEIYFGVIVRERPQLAVRVAELRAEHDVILSIVARLRELASIKSGWVRIVPPARVLIGMLAAHERAESQLLQEFLLGQSS